MKAALSDKTYLTDLDGFQVMGIEKALTYSNPKYQEALKQGRSVRGIDKHIQLFEHTGNGLSIPRGVSLASLGMMAETTRDEMHSHPVTIETIIEPRNYQERALKLAVHAGGGVIVAPTGAGKTTMGIELASRLGERCLILVKSKDLAAQWIGAIKKFTGLDCGIIGGGKWLEGEQFTVATVQTLIKHAGCLDYGLVIVDECHNVPPQKGQRYRCKLDSMQDVKREMAKVYREARSGLVDVQDATKLTWCLQAVGKVIEGSDLEKRIEALEKKT